MHLLAAEFTSEFGLAHSAEVTHILVQVPQVNNLRDHGCSGEGIPGWIPVLTLVCYALSHMGFTTWTR